MKKLFDKFRGIQLELFLIYLCIVILFVSAMLYVINTSAVRIYRNEQLANAEETGLRIQASLNSYLRVAQHILMQISADDITQQLMKKTYGEDNKVNLYYEGLDQKKAFSLMDAYRSILPSISCLFLHRQDGRYYYTASRALTQESITENISGWIDDYKNSDSFFAVVGPYRTSYPKFSSRLAISLVQQIQDIELLSNLRITNSIGLISMEIYVDDMISSSMSSASIAASSRFIITNSSGMIIYSNDKSFASGSYMDGVLWSSLEKTEDESQSINYKNDTYYFETTVDSLVDWHIITFTTKNDIKKAMDPMRIELMLFTGLILIITLVANKVLSRRFVQSIYNLREMMIKIENGQFGITIEVTSADELGQLTEICNKMSLHLKELVDQIITNERKIREAEIHALQSQINPHFLYNTLGTVRNMAVIQKSDGIGNMIDALNKLLRSAAQFESKYISIEQELELLKAYVYIQETRYLGKFDIEYYIGTDVLKYGTLPLLLQPIVENAIFHGVVPKDGFGHIKVSIEKNGNSIVYKIQDDGVGIPDEVIAKMNNGQEPDKRHELKSADATQKAKISLGVVNVGKRVKLSFGEDFGLHVESRVGIGTKITITTPQITEFE